MTDKHLPRVPGFESGVLYEILDCATNRILPVPHRLDSVVRFALPLRAPAPESLPGMHLPHPSAGPGCSRGTSDPPPATKSLAGEFNVRSYNDPRGR